MACWGYGGDGQASPPGGEVQVGERRRLPHLRGEERAASSPAGAATATARPRRPGGKFRSVGAGDSHTCGVKTSGMVACWGDDGNGQASPPGGKFRSVSAGGIYTCGVKKSGRVACWGYDGDGQASPPGGKFKSVSAGGDPHLRGEGRAARSPAGVRRLRPGLAARGRVQVGERRRRPHLRGEDELESPAGATTTRPRPRCPPRSGERASAAEADELDEAQLAVGSSRPANCRVKTYEGVTPSTVSRRTAVSA